MKRKKNQGTAWGKIFSGVVLIVITLSLLLLFEGKITGMADSGSGQVGAASGGSGVMLPLTKLSLTKTSPAKLVYAKTVSLTSGEKGGVIKLNLLENNKSLIFTVNKNLNEVDISSGTVAPSGLFVESEKYSLQKGIKQNKPITLVLPKVEEGSLVNTDFSAILAITYTGIKYFKVTPNKIEAKAGFYFQLLEPPLNISDGLVKTGLKMLDGKEKFIYEETEYAGVSIGGKTYSFKMLSDSSGEIVVYFNKLSDSVELTKSVTFPIENNGKVKVTVGGWSEDGTKLLADVQWIK